MASQIFYRIQIE